MEAVKGFKVYRMNDCDWYVAKSADDALSALADDVLNSCEEYADLEAKKAGLRASNYWFGEAPAELSDEEMDTLKFLDEEGEDGEGTTPVTRTFREQLVFDPPTEARMFASTEV